MNLYLSSYKLGNKVQFLIEWIKENGNEILLIINARDAKEQSVREKLKIQENIKMLEDIGFSVKLLDLKMCFGNSALLREKINGYRAFCAVGGNVFVLRMAMKLSGFDEFLKDSRNENMLYIGYSAGCCVLSRSLEGFNIVDEPINPYNDDKIIYDGVGLLDYTFIPHYKSNHPETVLIDKVVNYMEQNGNKYVTLSDGDVIIEKLT